MLRNLTAPPRDSLPEFFKMSGGGNDFVVIDHRGTRLSEIESFTRKICTRRLSAGADGLILIESSARATFKMRYLNADGSEADFCANGTRCAARFAFVNVIAPRKMTIETRAGVIAAEVHENQITLSLPPPREFIAERPLTTKSGKTIHGSSILIGVPHYVIFLKADLWAQDIEALGSELRSHAQLQPDGANIDFVVVKDRRSIEVRTWERGVEGETLSCGSGVVASVVTCALFGRVESPVSVLTRGGITLHVSFTREGETGIDGVKLSGDARIIYRAQLTPDTIEGFDPEWVRNPTGFAGP